jgi:hypothetical protein
MMIVLCECGQTLDDWREKECLGCRGEAEEPPEGLHSTPFFGIDRAGPRMRLSDVTVERYQEEMKQAISVARATYSKFGRWPTTQPSDMLQVARALTCVRDRFEEAFSLAAALHAEENRERIGEIVRDRPRDETYEAAERRVHALMWQRETAAVRERYAVRAVGLLLWMGGER